MQRNTALALFLVSSMISSNAMAAGYEKSVLWSGEYAGVAGAATSVTNNAQSLFFNPAGLAWAKGGHLSGQFSPTFTSVSAPDGSGGTLDSETEFSPVGAALASYNWGKLGVGVGYFVSGGNVINYGTLAGATAPLFVDLSITEASVGVGYELFEGMRVGAAYRVVFVGLDAGSGGSPAFNELDGLSSTNFFGFRLGAQFSPGEKWGLGVNYRTSTHFSAEGTAVGGALNGQTVTFASNFPWAATIGGFYEFSEGFRGLIEYSYAGYEGVSQNQTLGGTEIRQPTEWDNQNQIRVGAVLGNMPGWEYRAGYMFTSQVTPDTNASQLTTPPGPAHTITAGLGTRFGQAGGDTIQPFEVNGALEYSMVSGEGAAPAVTGEYDANAYAAHIGVTYHY